MSNPANILTEQWKTKRFLLDKKQVYPLSPLLFTIVLEELTLLKFPYYQKQSTASVQFLSKFQQYFPQK